MTAAAPWLVALDVDGTLMSYDGVMSDAVREAVAAVQEAGHHVVIATGRSVAATVPVILDLGLDAGWAVSSNGAVVLRVDPGLPAGYQIVDLVTFDPGPVLRLLRAELPDALYAVEDLGRGFRVSGSFPAGELAGVHTEADFAELCATPATRVVVRSTAHTSEDFHRLVARVGLREVTYAVGWTAWLDLTPPGVSKASALEAIRLRLAVPAERTLAVGDGRNDVEMLTWARRGVAMGHADDVVRAAADEVTGGVDDDGIVAVLRSLPDAADRRDRAG